MAKTRIKTTPTRMQKDALMASTATTTTIITKPSTSTCQVAAPLEDAKKRLRHPAALNKPMQSSSSTIIVTAPKRTNSISSVASSISQNSDAHSDTESPSPLPVMSTAMPTTTIPTKSNRSLLISHAAPQAPRTLNSLLGKPTNSITALRNRKVFMITEKLDETAVAETSTSTSSVAATVGQKRKMYLIMEENSCTEDAEGEEGGNAANDAQKYLKRENGLIVGASGSKKLTLFADKTDSGALTEKFEKILPEILNRIQAKDVGAGPMLTNVTPTPTSASKLLNGTVNLNIVKSEPIQPQQQQQQKEQYLKKTTETTNERLPITLPPKKNRTKIISTHNNNNHNSHTSHNGINIMNDLNDNFNSNATSIWENYNNGSSSSNSNNNNYKIGTQCQIKQISAATPVIVSTNSAAARNNNHNSNNSNSSSSGNDVKRFAPNNNKNNTSNTTIRYVSTRNGQAAASMPPQVDLVTQKNINLSTDFHFLIKMLPKLESIPEPHKNNVKTCIEKIITQNANIFAKQ